MNRIWDWLFGMQQEALGGQSEWGFRFVSDYGPYINLLLLAVLAGLVFLTVRSYRREGDAPRRVKAILAGLRIAVIVILVAILFRPAIVLRVIKTLHSSVVVLVDDSQSMSTSDRYGGDSEYQKQLAQSLKLTSSQLEAKSRLQIARELMERKDGAISQLAKDHPLVVMKFSTTQPGKESYTRRIDTVEAMSAPGSQDPADATVPPRFTQAINSLAANGYETNLAEAIRGALDNVQGQRTAGIVLLSDGQMTSEDAGSRLASAIEYARQRGVAIYPVSIGDPTQPKNVAVTALQAPRQVRKAGNDDAGVEFAAIIAHRNAQGQKVTLRLEQRPSDKDQWTDAGVKETVTLSDETSGAKGVQTVVLKVRATQVGSFVYRAVVDPLADEQNVKDNSAEALVRVVDNKINVLLIAGDSGWEFQYLRNFLQRQNELYRVSVWQQNADPEISQSASSPEMRLQKMPRDLMDLIGDKNDPAKPGYHVVILYDPQRTKEGFDEPFVAALKQFVGEHGGGLCYLAGNKYSDENVDPKSGLKDLADMLPVTLGTDNGLGISQLLNDSPPQPLPLTVTSYGVDHQITRLGTSADENAKIWSILPGVYWSHPVSKINPLARVLLENPSRQTAKNEREPVVALHMFGKGPVVYVGTDDTWRWRELNDAVYHKRFWNNIVGFLATLKASRMVITTGGDRFNAGEEIKIDVEAYDEKFKPLTDKTLDLEVIDHQTGATRPLTLSLLESKDKAGRYRGILVPSHQGVYELAPRNRDAGEAKRIVVELPQAEALRTEANEETMKSLATRNEFFLRSYDMDQLGKLIPSGKLTTVREDPRELWDRPVWLILLVVLLGAEWILRKKHNMA